MKPVMKIKLLTDLVMTVILLCQMGYMLVGEASHEWMGAAMFLLFILHHVLNLRWYKNLIRGKYTPLRIFQTIVNFIMLICMLGLMISGIMMSRHVFAFLDLRSHMGFARILHMLCSYWGFLFMSIHIGLHWGMVMNMAGRLTGKDRKAAGMRTWVLRALAFAVGICGICAFIKHDIASYLFLRSMFVFFDVSQPLAQFLAEYLSIMGLWAEISYYAARGLQKITAKR